MSFVVIIIASCLLADLLVWARGGWRLAKKGAGWMAHLFFHLFMLLETGALATIVLTRVQGGDVDAFMPLFVLILVYIWHLLVLPVVLVMTLTGIGFGVLRSFWRKVTLPPSQSMIRPRLVSATGGVTRREFIGSATVIAAPLLTFGLGIIGASQLSQVRVRRLTLNLPQLPEALDGLTLVQLTDTHVGRFTNGGVLEEMVELTRALKPDFVVFTGDLLNDSLGWLPEAASTLEKIGQPVYLCEGNHDLFRDAELFRETMKATPNVRALFQEAHTESVRGVPVQFLGLRWGGPATMPGRRHGEEGVAASMQELMALRDPSAFSILLAHHPHAWDYAPGVPLVFAGHTHGGQFMVNEEVGMGPAMFRYWSGLYTRQEGGASGLVVSNGSGNWFPLRIEAPAEIIHLTLKKA